MAWLSVPVLLAALIQAPAPQTDARLPVPAPAAQKDAEHLIRDVFKDEFAKKGPSDRKDLAKKLLAQGQQTKDDPVARYVLLRESRGMAADVGDVETALGAVDELAKAYQVDGLGLRQATLSTLALMAKTAPEWKELASAHLRLAEEAAAAEQFEITEKSASAAVQLATRAKELSLVTRAQSMSKEAGDLKTQHDKVRKATEDLVANPDDPSANLAVGRFRCLVRARWDEGLPLLAKGKDEALKTLAAADLAAPADVPGQIAVGDGWWTWSEKESGQARLQARLRAAEWYAKAQPGAVGLTRARLEKRMAELGYAREVNLLSLIDLNRDRVQGNWTCDGKTLTGIHTQFPARVQIPYEPPAEYDLTLVVERIEGGAPVHIGLVREGVQFYAAIDDFGGTVTGIGAIDGKLTNNNETGVPGPLLSNNKPATILCSVRRNEIAVSIDGKKVTSFKGGNDRLSSHPAFTMPNRQALYVGSGNASYAISKISLLPAAGQGKSKAEPPAAPLGFNPSGSGPSVDLLKAIDPNRDTLKGTWTVGAEGRLTSQPGQALLQAPYELPDEYEVTMVVVPTKAAEVYLGLVLEKVQFDLSVDGWAGTISGVGSIDGKMADSNETAYRGQILKSDAPNTIVCSVRKNSLTLTVNGQKILTWKPEPGRLSVNNFWTRPVSRTLAVGGWRPYTVTKLELTTIAGRGKSLR